VKGREEEDGRRGAGEKGGNAERSEKLRQINFEIFAYRVNNLLYLVTSIHYLDLIFGENGAYECL
jgi:hypothetical protein